MAFLAPTAFAMADITMIKDTKSRPIRGNAPYASGGYSNRRSPAIHKLLTRIDYRRISPAAPKISSYIEDKSFYRISTRMANKGNTFWDVNFKRAASSKTFEYYGLNIYCARDIK